MVVKLNSKEINYKPLITRSIILHYFTSLELFNVYVPGLKMGKPCISPLRPNESNPSFSVFQANNDIVGNYLYKDHGGDGSSGDVFKYIGLLYNISFTEVLSLICMDLGLNNKYSCRQVNKKTKVITISDIVKAKKIKPFIKNTMKMFIGKREWQPHDIKFWRDFGITLQVLKRYNVFPLSSFRINNYVHTADKHAYVFIEEKDGKETYKIYQPFNVHGLKWRSSGNSSVWHGWEQLPDTGDVLIITKSLKDVMAIVTNTPYSAVSLQSEITIPKLSVMDELNTRFLNIALLYDNDYDKSINTGQLQAEKIISTFEGRTRNLFNIKIETKHESKDFSDFIQEWGINFASKTLIEQISKEQMPF